MKLFLGRKSVPTIEVGGDFGELVAVESGFFDAVAFLVAVVVEESESVLAQGDDSDEVAGREECHKEVSQIPYEFEAGECAKEDHHSGRENAVEGEDEGGFAGTGTG